MGISRRAYAARRGVSHTAVAKAIRSGRISIEPDGSIDPDRADAEWERSTDPSKQRARDTTPRAAAPPVVKPVPRAAVSAVNETLHESGGEPGAGGGDAKQVNFNDAKTANEVLKAQTARLRLQKMKGDLVDRARATTMIFDLARRERDAWMNWPPRIAANMAADLGVDAHLMEQVLERYLREHLADLAEVKLELR